LFMPSHTGFIDMIRIYFICSRLIILCRRLFSYPFNKPNVILGYLWEDILLFEFNILSGFFKLMFKNNKKNNSNE
jgi:hypothetical protein